MSISVRPDSQGPQLACQLPGARQGRDPARAIKRGPRGVSAEVVAATQRDRLYDGLVHTVAEKGYANARITDICRAAGVTRPVFYELFQGKEDAFLATYRHGTHVLLAVMRAAYDRAAGAGWAAEVSEGKGDQVSAQWPLRVRASLAALLDVLAQVPAFATMAVVEIDAVGPAAREERRQLLCSFHQFFVQAPAPPPPARHEHLVAAVVGGVYAMVFDCVATGRGAELAEQEQHLSYCLLAPFLGPTAAAEALD